jgi:hypothetical protein
VVPAFISPRQQQLVDGSVERVAAVLQDGLSDAGILVLSKRVGSEIRLAGQTKTHKIFCIHLYGKMEGKTAKTLVRMKWDKEADESFWNLIVQLLATTEADDAAKGSDVGAWNPAANR